MAATVSKKVKVEEVTSIQYTTSDGKVFDRPDRAEIHEELIGLEQKFKDLGVKTVEDAYFCRTEEEFKTVVNLLAYREANFRWPSGNFEPYFRYQNAEFSGPDWYFFLHETNMDYPDEYWVETLSQKKKKFNNWVKEFEDAEV